VPDHEWRELYRAAVIEVIPGVVLQRVDSAETAMFRRLEALAHQPDSRQERMTIYEALSSLGALKSDARHWTAENQPKYDDLAADD
jgi:hypothetical protein